MMAIAGIVMCGYLILHMLTNLSFFSASTFEAFYAVYNLPFIRWPLLLLVVTALAIHVKVAITLRRINSKARGQEYHIHDGLHIPATLVTVSIAFLLFFIVIHIIQMLTLDSGSVYQAIHALFQSFWMLGFYLAGLLVLAMHLAHSLANVLQTLGITSRSYHRAVGLGVFVFIAGFASVPLYSYIVMI